MLLKPLLDKTESDFLYFLEKVREAERNKLLRFGRRIGSKLIRQDAVGKNLMRIVQLEEFETNPVSWTFYFYRTNDGWILAVFNTEDDMKKLFTAP